MAKKRTHKQKPEAPVPFIEGDFELVACDLSMLCPGFARLLYHADTRTVELLQKSQVNNKTENKNNPRLHGRNLALIGDAFCEYAKWKDVKLFVRERALSRFHYEVQVLNKVVGVVDYLLWQLHQQNFTQITATEVKKYVAGNGRATKEDVANALSDYVGEQTYHSDNESDAVAIGIAWLIREGYIDCKYSKEEETSTQ